MTRRPAEKGHPSIPPLSCGNEETRLEARRDGLLFFVSCYRDIDHHFHASEVLGFWHNLLQYIFKSGRRGTGFKDIHVPLTLRCQYLKQPR